MFSVTWWRGVLHGLFHDDNLYEVFSLRIFFWNIVTRTGLTTNLVKASPSRIFTTTTQIKIKKIKY